MARGDGAQAKACATRTGSRQPKILTIPATTTPASAGRRSAGGSWFCTTLV